MICTFPLASQYAGPVGSKACLGVQSHGTGEGSATALLVCVQAEYREGPARVFFPLGAPHGLGRPVCSMDKQLNK